MYVTYFMSVSKIWSVNSIRISRHYSIVIS